MAALTVRERERKLAADASFRVPDLTLSGAATLDRPGTLRMAATYYDTEDLRLARAGVTLRRRTGGGDAGWHLKLPVGVAPNGIERDEVRLPLKAGGEGDVPGELVDLTLGMTRGAELRPLAAMRTRRTPYRLATRDGRLVAEVVDDRVTVTSGPAEGLTYRELEVEDGPAADANPQPIEHTLELLEAAGAQPGSFSSKGLRALGLTGRPDPVVPEPQPCSRSDPAGDAVTAHLRTHVRALLAQDPRVRQGLPDAVHQFRVAARRLRAGLQTFAPLVDDEWSRYLRGELGWIAGVLGAARDREVLERRLLNGIRALPPDLDRAAGYVVVQDDLESGMAEAVEQAAVAMRSDRYLALLDALVDAANHPRLTPLAQEPSRTALPPLVDRRWQKLAAEADLLPDELDGHDEHWHQTRITAKKARYAAEACVPVFGSRAERLAEQLERVTELLGEHQDCAIAADTVHALVTRETGPQAAFTLGALYAQQRQRVAEVRREFVEVWPAVRAPRWRRWLRTKG
jgi:CHAD domain-containing protein